jgi:hypothetical protein
MTIEDRVLDLLISGKVSAAKWETFLKKWETVANEAPALAERFVALRNHQGRAHICSVCQASPIDGARLWAMRSPAEMKEMKKRVLPLPEFRCDAHLPTQLPKPIEKAIANLAPFDKEARRYSGSPS